MHDLIPRLALSSCALAALLPCVAAAQAQTQTQPPLAWLYSPLSQAQCAAYSPGGQELLVGGVGGVQIYNAATGALTGCIPTHVTGVTTLVYSPNGKTLAIGGSYSSSTQYTGIVELWNVASGSLTTTLYPQVTQVQSVAFSPDGLTLADGGYFFIPKSSQTGQPLQLWNVATGKSTGTLATSAFGVQSLKFSPDGKTLIDGGYSAATAVVEEWTVATGQLSQTIPTSASEVNSIAISPDGKTLALGGLAFNKTTFQDFGVLELWTLATTKLNTALKTTANTLNSIAFSPDGSKLVDAGYGQTSTSGVLELWNVAKGSLVSNLNRATNNGESFVAFSPNGKSLVECGLLPAPNQLSVVEVRQWTVSSGALASTLAPNYYSWNTSTAFGADGSHLAVAGTTYKSGSTVPSGWLGLWNSSSVGLTNSFTMGSFAIDSVAFSPDGKALADVGPSSPSAVIELRNAQTGKVSRTMGTPGTALYGVATFSPDSSLLAVGGEVATNTIGALELWSVSTGKVMATLKTAASGGIDSLDFSPDGKILAAGGTEVIGNLGFAGSLELWSAVTGNLLTTLYPSLYSVSAVKFAPDGSVLAIGGLQYIASTNSTVGAVQLWDARTGKLSSVKMAPNTGSLSSLVFSPDSKILYAGTPLGIQVFDAQDYSLLDVDAVGPVNSLAASSDGKFLSFTTTVPSVGVISNPIAGVKLSRTYLFGGSSVVGTVMLSSPAPAVGLEIALSSSDPSAAIQSTITIGSGKTSATFTIKTSAVADARYVGITAIAESFSQTAYMGVEPPSLSTLGLSPLSVKGGQTSTGTVTLSGPAPTGGTVVSLSSSSKSATVPKTVTIPAGKLSATFTVTTTKVTAKTSATVTATLGTTSESVSLSIS